MRDAARRFEGTHDFRNLCKMDARNVRHVRTVYRCDVVTPPTPAPGKTAAARARAGRQVFATKSPYVERPYVDLTPELWNLSRVPPGLCYVRVEGSAFLWHQVRCMAAVLFLVGLAGKPQISSTRCWTRQSSKTESRSTRWRRMRRWCCGGAGSRDALRLRRAAARADAGTPRHTAASLGGGRLGSWGSLRAEAEPGEEG